METKRKKPTRTAERSSVKAIPTPRGKIAERDRRQAAVQKQLDHTLAVRVKDAYYGEALSVEETAERFKYLKPRQWIEDVIFYRIHRTAETLGSFH